MGNAAGQPDGEHNGSLQSSSTTSLLRSSVVGNLAKPSQSNGTPAQQAAIRRKSAQLRKQRSTGNSFLNGVEEDPAIALCISIDGSCQTDESATSMRWKSLSSTCSCGRIFLCVFVMYFSVCFLAIKTSYVQTLAGYAHIVKWPNRDLTDLSALNLPQARNFEVVTADGVRLRGWHLMNPSLDLIRANSCNSSEERELIFDEALAHASRIVVFFHGNSATRGQPFRVDLVKQLAVYLDAHVISFDYRGFADSEGTPSEYGTLLDGKAIVQWIHDIVVMHNANAIGYIRHDVHKGRNTTTIDRSFTDGLPSLSSMYHQLLQSGLQAWHHLISFDNQSHNSNSAVVKEKRPFSDNTNRNREASKAQITAAANDSETTVATTPTAMQPRLYFYGHSLGAAIGAALAANMSEGNAGAVSGLILDAPFTTMMEAAKTHPITAVFRIFPIIFKAMLNNAFIRYATIDIIDRVGAPLLLLHGLDDHKVPASNSIALFEKATGVCQSTLLSKHQHGEVVSFSSSEGNCSTNEDGVLNGKHNAKCAHFVAMHHFPGANHNQVYTHRKWLVILPLFVSKVEMQTA